MHSHAHRLGTVAILGALAFAAPSAVATATSQHAPLLRQPFAAREARGHDIASATLLFSFGSASGTYGPFARLVADSNGNLYGTTEYGGNNTGECAEEGGFNGVGCGGVFKLTPSSSGKYTESFLYKFAGSPSDGAVPYGELYIDANGNLYGTTAEGGSGTCVYGGTNYGCGVVYKLTPSSSGSSYTETVLYSFQGGMDAAYSSSGLVADASGNLYGTSQNGGGTDSLGTVFKLSKRMHGYTERVLHRFAGCSGSSGAPCDGADPWASLYLSSNGDLFGTTLYGGSHQCIDGNPCGTVFRLSPRSTGVGYVEKVIYNFQGGTDGEAPQGGLTADTSGNLYGATSEGGGYSWKQCNNGSIIRGCGVVFKLVPHNKGYRESVLYAFEGGLDAAVPQAGVLLDSSGDIFGTSNAGGEPPSNGSGGCGTLWELTPGASYTETVLDRFQGCRSSSTDPSNPSSGLIEMNGVLYGTSAHGGKFGSGSVFSFPA